MDVASARAFAVDFQRSEVSCSKKCNADGRDRMRASAEGPGLVTNYKQCMVKADSTHEARKLAVYERDLYCDVLRKADSRARTTAPRHDARRSPFTASCGATRCAGAGRRAVLARLSSIAPT
jgi:hypothetical protein